MKYSKIALFSLFIVFFFNVTSAQYRMKGNVVEETIQSTVLRANKIGLNTSRDIKIYLPPGYSSSRKKYPVVYYLHSLFENIDRVVSDQKTPEIIDKSIEKGITKEFVFVVADFSSPTVGSLYENSSTSGLWLDFISKELVPFIDGKYRTISDKDSRAVFGHFMGGRGALKVAMEYPKMFGIVYALHPVATGSGYLPRISLGVDWEKIHQAKSFEEVGDDIRTKIFASVCQAFLPNANRAPLYCDFLFEKDENGALQLDPNNVRKEQKEFHLDERLDHYAENLRSLKAIAFDWARFDQTQDHVISNRRFSKKLMDLGVDHVGVEFVGDPWNKYWGDEGRIATRVLPFLNKHLSF
ncbi:alpha/beta hydrolase [Aquimarina litoralis]|uniref:alpha/beta hydrolase n=1 Tax=Aquimarina litoralis TaxID=584605 RepID=UPI001C5A4D09|nr:alpha/beta hydrolase-fold protein [Aquimarina litoralis]MBW1297748.1 esterase [Aquimarina litoralis]